MFSLDFTSYWVHFALLRDSVRFFTFHLEVNDVGLAFLVNIILHLLLYSNFKGVYWWFEKNYYPKSMDLIPFRKSFSSAFHSFTIINILWKYHFGMKIFGKCENISYFLNFKYLKVWVLDAYKQTCMKKSEFSTTIL